MSTPAFRAVIFDLDGVLWDGEPLYHEAFNLILEPYGFRLSENEYTEIIGLSVEAAWVRSSQDLLRRHRRKDLGKR